MTLGANDCSSGSRSDVDGRGQLELQPRLGRQLQMFLPAGRDRGAGHPADGGADGRPAAAAGNPSDDRAEAGAAADFARGFLAFALALRLT